MSAQPPFIARKARPVVLPDGAVRFNLGEHTWRLAIPGEEKKGSTLKTMAPHSAVLENE